MSSQGNDTVAKAPLPKSGPLKGVRIVDMTLALMGPYCTQILADLGADVVKVESPDGDTTRFLPPGHHADRGGMFVNMNRGKRSIVLDLKQNAARDALLRLVEKADVLVHSMRPQAMAKLKLTYQDLLKVNPQLIYANLYGFGRTGPYAELPAYDDVIQAATGIAMLQGEMNEGKPAYLATVVADKVGGLTALYAINAALFHRAKTGEGQEIEVAMFETLTSFVMTEHLCGSLFDPPLGPPVYPRVVSPNRKPYQTKDGHISALVYNDKHYRNFFAALGNPEWTTDPRFATFRSRADHVQWVYGRLGEEFATRTTAEWMELLRRAEVPAMPLWTTTDLLHDPHLEQVGFWKTLDTKEGRMRFPGIPTWFSKTPGQITEAGPALGEHGPEVLAENGFSAEEIERLTASGALRPMSDGNTSNPKKVEKADV
jgi:crotonobetainyl-CoA:carnitine CoA-transferase CaiB-like acyl-CoA transferase